jgi:hypothetical protein
VTECFLSEGQICMKLACCGQILHRSCHRANWLKTSIGMVSGYIATVQTGSKLILGWCPVLLPPRKLAQNFYWDGAQFCCHRVSWLKTSVGMVLSSIGTV